MKALPCKACSPVSAFIVPVILLTQPSRPSHTMFKPAGVIFLAACVLVPGYAVYANAISRQSNQHQASQMDSGELLINSNLALMRARHCQIVLTEPTQEIAATLVGLTGLALEEGDPGPQFVCGLDGSTAKQMRGRFGEFVTAKESDLKRFHDILKVRGLITDENVAGYNINE